MNIKRSSITIAGSLALLSFGVASACGFSQGADELGLSREVASYAYVNGGPMDACDAFRLCIHLGTDQGQGAGASRNAEGTGSEPPSVGLDDYNGMLPDRSVEGAQVPNPILGKNCDGGVAYAYVADNVPNVCEIYAGATQPVLARIAATGQAIAQNGVDAGSAVAFD